MGAAACVSSKDWGDFRSLQGFGSLVSSDHPGGGVLRVTQSITSVKYLSERLRRSPFVRRM